MNAPLFEWQQPPAPSYPDGVPADVCLTFERLALELIRDGFERYSADAILHQIRWQNQVERGDRAFFANNNWAAPLARWFLKRNPWAGGFFQMRSSSAKAAPIRAYAD